MEIRDVVFFAIKKVIFSQIAPNGKPTIWSCLGQSTLEPARGVPEVRILKMHALDDNIYVSEWNSSLGCTMDVCVNCTASKSVI